MMKNTFIDEIIVVNAEIGDAFKLVSDINNWAKWCTPVKRAKMLSRGQLHKGSIFYFIAKAKPLPAAPLLVSVLSHKPKQHISWGFKLGNK